jgi:hypothetical protein
MLHLNIAHNLLSQIRPEVAAQHSFLNYHAPGMDYLCLLRSDDLTVKLYMTNRGRLRTCGTMDFLVNPHNHAYNFMTYVISGHVTNINFVERDDRKGWFRSNYKDRKVSDPKETSLHKISSQVYRENENYYLDHWVIHTISVPLHQQTCLMLFQYRDQPKDHTLYFSPKAEAPNTEGLYIKPDSWQTMDLIRKAKTFLNYRG